MITHERIMPLKFIFTGEKLDCINQQAGGIIARC